MSLRQYVYDLLTTDATLTALGYNASTIYGAAPDGVQKQRFMILRWGTSGPRAGRDTIVRRTVLTVWVYDRERDYAAIAAALTRVCAIVLPSLGTHGSGYVLDVEDNGASDDLYDPTYEAVMRNWAFTITASET